MTSEHGLTKKFREITKWAVKVANISKYVVNATKPGNSS